MNKGELTKETILQRAGELFNTKGYAAASISDIMEVTGLQKGGIYNHFKSKEELTVAAFEFIARQESERFIRAIKQAPDALSKLEAVIVCFRMYNENSLFRGGCPLLNAAVESDYSNPVLRVKVQEMMSDLKTVLIHIIQNGINRRQIKPSVNSDYIATVLIAALEGGVMLSLLYDSSLHLESVIHHLLWYVRTELP